MREATATNHFSRNAKPVASLFEANRESNRAQDVLFAAAKFALLTFGT
jgi:hypothetical protein